MRDVAARAGVSQPFLSDLENGRAMPSITTLYRLADTFGLTPQHLLPTSPGDDVFVARAGNEPLSPVDDAPGVAMAHLVSRAPGRVIEARRYTLAAGLPADGWYEHEGEDLVFVLDGSVWIEFGNGSEEPLGAGDTMWHSGRVPHRWRTGPDAAAELLLVKGRAPAAGPEDERDHHGGG